MDESSAKGLNASSAGEGTGHGFEWIAHGDATARKRARAHVTRGFRRAKAAQAKKDKEELERRECSSSQSSSSPPQDDACDSPCPGQTTTPPAPADSTLYQPYEKTVENLPSDLHQGLALQWQLGTGRTDSFSTLPVELGPATHALLDHFLSGVAPVSFRLDTRADFAPVKELSFQVSLSDPSAFHVVLATAANDIAALQGQKQSPEGIRHRGLALELMNKRLQQPGSDTSDASVAAVALLAGAELLFGTPEGFNTHMRGLKSLLKLRGGLQIIQWTNPQLFAIIAWFDYSGSCNLLSRRRFNFGTPSSELLYSSPSGVPENILESLPKAYDLYRTVVDIFQGLFDVTSLLRSGSLETAQRAESSLFITKVDTELYRSILLPEEGGVRSRRRHIQQSLEIIALIYSATAWLHFQNTGGSFDAFLTRFKRTAIDENIEWGLTVTNVFRYLLLCEDFDRDEFSAQISSLYDVCAALSWEPWLNIKNALFQFFLYDEACEGRLQALWQRRMTTVSS